MADIGTNLMRLNDAQLQLGVMAQSIVDFTEILGSSVRCQEWHDVCQYVNFVLNEVRVDLSRCQELTAFLSETTSEAYGNE